MINANGLNNRSAFTLAELMIVIGAIGILAGIVVTAVNPRDQLVVANNSKRTATERDLTQFIQYAMTVPAAEAEVEEILSTARSLQDAFGKANICALQSTVGDCVPFDGLLAVLEEFQTLPVDVLAPAGLTGFSLFINEGGQTTVRANHRQERGGDDGGMESDLAVSLP